MGVSSQNGNYCTLRQRLGGFEPLLGVVAGLTWGRTPPGDAPDGTPRGEGLFSLGKDNPPMYLLTNSSKISQKRKGRTPTKAVIEAVFLDHHIYQPEISRTYADSAITFSS